MVVIIRIKMGMRLRGGNHIKGLRDITFSVTYFFKMVTESVIQTDRYEIKYDQIDVTKSLYSDLSFAELSKAEHFRGYR